jgi:UPF0042 nucleotide-binding protein
MKPLATGPTHTLHVISFGYLFGPPPEADLIFNVSDWFHDPDVHEDLRRLTGLHYAVIMNVLATEGVIPAIEALFEAIAVLVGLRVKPVILALGCRGGRHRSPCLADQIGVRGIALGWTVAVEHRDIHRPLLPRRRRSSVES